MVSYMITLNVQNEQHIFFCIIFWNEKKNIPNKHYTVNKLMYMSCVFHESWHKIGHWVYVREYFIKSIYLICMKLSNLCNCKKNVINGILHLHVTELIKEWRKRRQQNFTRKRRKLEKLYSISMLEIKFNKTYIGHIVGTW